jgi:hypothetical protein
VARTPSSPSVFFAAGMNGGPSEAAFARYIGVAPHPYSSGSTDGHVRFTRSGNRQLNKAVHRIAVTHIRMDGPGRSYYDKRRGVGDSSPAALRSLKRRINRVVFSRLQADEPTVTHNRTQAWWWLRPIPQADGVIARPRGLAGLFGDQTLHGGHLVSRGVRSPASSAPRSSLRAPRRDGHYLFRLRSSWDGK